MAQAPSLLDALRVFAAAVAEKTAQPTVGEPEDQLRAPFETFLKSAGAAMGWRVVCTGETPLPDRLGRPDYAVHIDNLLVGYVELKAPGVGATAARFKGRNREQFKRFSHIPNLFYSDGNEWTLYRNGELARKAVRLTGDVVAEGRSAVEPRDADALESLLRDYLTWQPIVPLDRRGRIDLPGFAALLAPLTRMLREDVAEALKDPASPLVQLAKDWRQLLFPDAPDEQFADAYAQTVAFALLLGRGEGADPLTLKNAEAALAAQHNLLSRALQVLTDERARGEMAASLDLLLRVVAAAPPAAFTKGTGTQSSTGVPPVNVPPVNVPPVNVPPVKVPPVKVPPGKVPPGKSHGRDGHATFIDPWLYFYEDFLAAYDPKLRKDAGAYYTPVEVVRCQVRLIDDLLGERLGRPLGFADPGVVTLDPAAGTGTYLLGVIEHALGRVEAEQGAGAVAGRATELARNLYGFELMVGPYAVAELRVSRALRDRGAALPPDGTHVYLTDTLESPHAEPPSLPFYLQPISEQHEKALRVKSDVPVIVCLGNPPYDRHEATVRDKKAGVTNKARTGGWVRWGDAPDGADAVFRDFLDPATAAGHGVRVHNLYNLYVYFWRWALWKVFESKTAAGPGVVSFISASSYLDGDAFGGMREHLRRQCDEIWILDLGGEGRGTRKSENVFAIQTPVAVAIAFRSGEPKEKSATVRYHRIEGTRAEKLGALDKIRKFRSVKWKKCPDVWQAPFRPAGKGDYFRWPLLTDLMPWQQSGVKAGRTWVISPEEETLRRCWRVLLNEESVDRKRLFKDSPTGRKVHEDAVQLPPSTDTLEAITDLPGNSPPPGCVRIAYRSFDRQFVFADARLLDRPSPVLWNAHGNRQLYLTTLLNHPLGQGPAISASALIPDLHHFRGSFGAKETIPLYRDAEATEPNLFPCLLTTFGKHYGRALVPEDMLAYFYGILAHPGFTARFRAELDTRELRVPIAKDPALFEAVRAVGARLLWLHTYGERLVPKGKTPGQIPRGAAKCTKAVPGDPNGYPEEYEYNASTKTLRVGVGEFAPVAPEVYAFEVSGLKVVQSWLKYRMKHGGGKKSSPLDDIRPERWTGAFTTELLELVWVLEATVAGYPEQARLLESVAASDCFAVDEFPPVPEEARQPPAPRRTGGDLFDGMDEE